MQRIICKDSFEGLLIQNTSICNAADIGSSGDGPMTSIGICLLC